MEMVAGSNDAAALARRLNVDPDMSEKVLVPLLISLINMVLVGQ